MKPKFFSNPTKFRNWLEKNHNRKDELIVGYYKVASGKPSMTWSESVDQALCYGWIDGIRRSICEISYCIRFTPRRPRSTWSAVNLKKIQVLTKLGLMNSEGIKAYKKRTTKNSEIYSHEQKYLKLKKEYEKKLKANKKAWAYFESLAPSYKKPTIWWVMSAKKEETQIRRLDILISSSSNGKLIPQLIWEKKK